MNHSNYSGGRVLSAQATASILFGSDTPKRPTRGAPDAQSRRGTIAEQAALQALRYRLLGDVGGTRNELASKSSYDLVAVIGDIFSFAPISSKESSS